MYIYIYIYVYIYIHTYCQFLLSITGMLQFFSGLQIYNLLIKILN